MNIFDRLFKKCSTDMSENIPRLIHEGYPQDQAVAIAYSEAGEGDSRKRFTPSSVDRMVKAAVRRK